MSDLPEWTLRGGFFRPNFGTNDVPQPWARKKGRWKRDELVPYGKASEEYRKKYFTCPDCFSSLVIAAEEYRFKCENCFMVFGWHFGGLLEHEQDQVSSQEDF